MFDNTSIIYMVVETIGRFLFFRIMACHLQLKSIGLIKNLG